MRASYDVMMDSYKRIFDRCGLSYVIVEADPGTIGGGVNHEFMALAGVGEDLYVSCPNGDYLADTEAAMPRAPDPADASGSQPLTDVHTPNAATIDELPSSGVRASEDAQVRDVRRRKETVAVLRAQATAR